MSKENVEIVQRIYDEVVASPESVRELYHPDYELMPPTSGRISASSEVRRG
jgi:hypothetical protein